MPYRHHFRCALCGKHVTYQTEHATPVAPGRTHDGALSNGGEAVGSRDPGPEQCLGRLDFCSGHYRDAKSGQFKECQPKHSGSYEVKVAARQTEDAGWTDFKGRVAAAWAAFRDSGYNVQLRGVNNNREYRPPQQVFQLLAGSGGSIQIDGGVYTVSNSNTADVSLHRTIPQQHQIGQIRSFIFHL